MNKNKALVVKKDNALVSSSYSLTLAEQRMVLLAIADGGQQALNGRHVVTAEQYADCYKVTSQAAYMALKDAALQLFERRYTIRSEQAGGRVKLRRWVSGIDYIEGAGSVELYFSPDVLEYLDELKSKFTAYRLELVAGLTSTHAIRLYELLIQWRSVGKTPVFELATFREMLGILPDEYPRMTDFKKRVLDVAVMQINEHTDIKAEYEQHKRGRSITGFSFTFALKQPDRDPNTVDMLTGKTDNETGKQIALTGEQAALFASKLAADGIFGSRVARNGELPHEFRARIQQELGQPEKVAQYMPHLLRLGFKLSMGKKR